MGQSMVQVWSLRKKRKVPHMARIQQIRAQLTLISTGSDSATGWGKSESATVNIDWSRLLG